VIAAAEGIARGDFRYMAGIKPPAGFERQPLDIETIPSGRRFGRIYASAFPYPLGFGKTASRFSDPRRRDATKRFGVLYLGETLKVCFLEAVLRHRRDGLVCDFHDAGNAWALVLLLIGLIAAERERQSAAHVFLR
jgi:hypothetical protein